MSPSGNDLALVLLPRNRISLIGHFYIYVWKYLPIVVHAVSINLVS